MSHNKRLAHLEAAALAAELAELDALLRKYSPDEKVELILICRKIQAGESIPPDDRARFDSLFSAYSQFSPKARLAHAGRYRSISPETWPKIELFIEQAKESLWDAI